MPVFNLEDETLALKNVRDFAFRRRSFSGVARGDLSRSRVDRAHQHLLGLIEKRTPIYGVTTGFGDSCHRVVSPEKAFELQKNLVAYLACGTGPIIPIEATRAMFLVHLKSLSRGYSGVSNDLLDRMALFLEKDWIPVVPREGSLGASGDLIPLSYLARVLQGEGEVHSARGPVPVAELMRDAGVKPYTLKPKEGLSLVNGTSAMSGLCLLNLARAQFLLKNLVVAGSWQCLALNGRVEAFGVLVNEKAKRHDGQAWVASRVRALLDQEGYSPERGQSVKIKGNVTEGFVQDRYSLRCVPQILGPIQETLELASTWLEREVNGTADNPLIDDEGHLSMGGNFYGGYLGHGMDYLKIGLANMADLADRQLMMLMDDKSNRGLPPNLADWNSLPESDRHLHHGLKGLHQSASAITSEIIQKSFPASVLSRSAESHNQDKVSLGMSAAVQASEMVDALFTVQTLQLICLAQALEIRGRAPRGRLSKQMFELIRSHVPFVKTDVALGAKIRNLSEALKHKSLEKEEDFHLEEI